MSDGLVTKIPPEDMHTRAKRSACRARSKRMRGYAVIIRNTVTGKKKLTLPFDDGRCACAGEHQNKEGAEPRDRHPSWDRNGAGIAGGSGHLRNLNKDVTVTNRL